MPKTSAAKKIEEPKKESVATPEEQTEKKAGKGTKSVTVKHANFYVHSSYNNILASLTDERGNVLAWASSGSAGFKGPRKATPFAASKVIENIFTKLGKTTVENATIFINGIGAGRDSALRGIAGRGITITAIHDITPIPHNGCKPKKVRRV